MHIYTVSRYIHCRSELVKMLESAANKYEKKIFKNKSSLMIPYGMTSTACHWKTCTYYIPSWMRKFRCLMFHDNCPKINTIVANFRNIFNLGKLRNLMAHTERHEAIGAPQCTWAGDGWKKKYQLCWLNTNFFAMPKGQY